MAFIRVVFRILIGVVFGIGCSFMLIPAFAALAGDELVPGLTLALMAASIILVTCVAAWSRSVRRAFGWGFLLLGLCTVLLPVSTMLLAGRVMVQQVSVAEQSTKAATALGSTIGAGLLTGAASIVGLFLGAVFLVIALVLLLGGGRREVILVDRATGRQVSGVAVHQSLAGGPRQRIEPPLE